MKNQKEKRKHLQEKDEEEVIALFARAEQRIEIEGGISAVVSVPTHDNTCS